VVSQQILGAFTQTQLVAKSVQREQFKKFLYSSSWVYVCVCECCCLCVRTCDSFIPITCVLARKIWTG